VRQNSNIAFDEAEPAAKAFWVGKLQSGHSRKLGDLSPLPLGEGAGVRAFSAMVCITVLRDIGPEVRERKALTPTVDQLVDPKGRGA
jgi:hypothetical protein